MPARRVDTRGPIPTPPDPASGRSLPTSCGSAPANCQEKSPHHLPELPASPGVGVGGEGARTQRGPTLTRPQASERSSCNVTGRKPSKEHRGGVSHAAKVPIGLQPIPPLITTEIHAKRKRKLLPRTR